MSSPFDAAMAAGAATHDAIMAESFEFRPMKFGADKNAPPATDPDRAVVLDLRAPWVDSAARVHADAFREPGVKAERPGHSSSRPAIALDLSRLTYKPKRGDRVVRKKTSTLYQVAEVVPGSPGFARLDLNEIGGAP